MSWSDLTHNLSYKFVALGVAIILWMSMLGRKDATLMKDFEVQVQLSPKLEMVSQVPQVIRVEIQGPRVALKKINQMNPVYVVDLQTAREGRQVLTLTREGLNLPVGARVLSISPPQLTVDVRQVKSGAGEH